MLVTFMVVAGLLSAFVDSVVAVAVLAPIIKGLSAYGVSELPYWWACLIGATYFGNLTPMGSVADIAALGVVERRWIGRVSLAEWFKLGGLVTLATSSVAALLLVAQLPLMS